MTHFVITKENERLPYLFVEAIFLGFHIRWGNGGLEIIGEHSEEDHEFIINRLGSAAPFPICDYDEYAKNLEMLIKRDPKSTIIQVNSFEYNGVYPMQF